MKSLRECLVDVNKEKKAIGHFNISNLETLKGIWNVAHSLCLPVIIGVSEGERNFIGTRQVANLIKNLREEFNHPIFLNADHCYSFEKIKEAIDAGYDSVIFDGTQMSYDENVAITKKCVEYARASGRDVLVEGELGFIGKSSKILDKLPDGVEISIEHLTKKEEAKDFVEKTGINLLAPAVGNIHGMLRSGSDPALNLEKLREIKKEVFVPIVLHGASGNSDEDLKGAIEAGTSIIHVNTEIRVAYRRGLIKGLEENPDELTPYKFLKQSVLEVEKVVEKKLKIFNGLV